MPLSKARPQSQSNTPATSLAMAKKKAKAEPAPKEASSKGGSRLRLPGSRSRQNRDRCVSMPDASKQTPSITSTSLPKKPPSPSKLPTPSSKLPKRSFDPRTDPGHRISSSVDDTSERKRSLQAVVAHNNISALPNSPSRHRLSSSVDSGSARQGSTPPTTPIKAPISPPSPVFLSPRSHESIRLFVKPDPQIVLQKLSGLLDAQTAHIRSCLDKADLAALHDRELMELHAKTIAPKSQSTVDRLGKSLNYRSSPFAHWKIIDVFNAPLRQIALYASSTVIMGGYNHDLPTIVIACVEELQRRTETTDIFSTTTTRGHARVAGLQAHLISSKEALNLSEELTEDIGSLLQSFLSRLPDSLVSPTETFHGALFACISLPVNPNDMELELTKIELVRTILRLLPTANLSLLVYLVSFLIRDARQTKMTRSLLFNWLFGRDSAEKGRIMLDYLLDHWDAIVEGLFSMDWQPARSALKQDGQSPMTPHEQRPSIPLADRASVTPTMPSKNRFSSSPPANRTPATPASDRMSSTPETPTTPSKFRMSASPPTNRTPTTPTKGTLSTPVSHPTQTLPAEERVRPLGEGARSSSKLPSALPIPTRPARADSDVISLCPSTCTALDNLVFEDRLAHVSEPAPVPQPGPEQPESPRQTPGRPPRNPQRGSLSMRKEGSTDTNADLNRSLDSDFKSVIGFRILEETVNGDGTSNLRGFNPCVNEDCPVRDRVEELEKQLKEALKERDEMRAAFEAFRKVMAK